MAQVLLQRVVTLPERTQELLGNLLRLLFARGAYKQMLVGGRRLRRLGKLLLS